MLLCILTYAFNLIKNTCVSLTLGNDAKATTAVTSQPRPCALLCSSLATYIPPRNHIIINNDAMSESYCTKLANEILDGAEKIADRFEEGLNIIMGAQSTDSTGSGTPPESPPADHEFEGWDGMEDGEVMDESSPLAGIAQGVMEDIMSAQVCTVVA